MKISILLTLLFLTLFKVVLSQQCNLFPPINLVVSEVNSCSATLHWNPGGPGQSFILQYKLITDHTWSKVIKTGTATSYKLNDLLRSSVYYARLRSVCVDGTKSKWKQIKIITSSCTLPLNVTYHITGLSNAKLALQTICPYDTIYYEYGILGQTMSRYFTVDSSQINLTGLQNNVYYTYRVSTCSNSYNNWTSTDTFLFITQQNPNILFILLDDSRFDSYSCNGAPSFFNTPAIDRIANEGVNFKNNFVVYSLCEPSRATIITGRYSGINGVVDNHTQNNLNHSLPVVPDLLKNHGYYTAFLGKNQNILKYNQGYYNYWLESLSTDAQDDKSWNHNGKLKYIDGLSTEIITDSALKVIQTAQQPFFIWCAYRATHEPFVSSPTYIGAYDDFPVPLKPDTGIYTVNYPSFLYSMKEWNYCIGDSLQKKYHENFEDMADADANIQRLLNMLDSTGVMNNTLIVFTSDNGHLHGEHHLYMKRLAYDPSMRTPLFIRYPLWFPHPAVVSNRITLNIDLPVTFLDAAGLENNFDMDGLSIRKLYDGDVTRNAMYYHSFYTTENNYGVVPNARAIRDLQFKYIKYGCINDTTEEFFDLINDPLEMNNLVNNSTYDSIIQTYRDKLMSMEIQFGDTVNEATLDCYIANPQNLREESSSSFKKFRIYPNPSHENLTLDFSIESDGWIEIRNQLGIEYYMKKVSSGNNTINLTGMKPGIYIVLIWDDYLRLTRKFIVE